MLRTGDILEHPPSGTRLVLRATAAETHGRAVVLELVLEPNGYRQPRHLHPRQRQRVEVLAGSAGVEASGRRAVVGPGARLDVPAGTPHRVWNAGDEPLHLVVELTPALRVESLLLAICVEGGRLRRALAAAAHRDTIRFVPFRVRRGRYRPPVVPGA